MSLPRCSRRPARARAAVVVVSTICLVATIVPAAAAPPPAFVAPVSGPVVDGFRPPSSPYGPGNRGLEYASVPGEEVRAAAGGEVVYAGRIGATAHVVVLHGDGLRTSYSFLTDVTVTRGEQVSQGQVVGVAGPVVHFGARVGERYVDPGLLLAGAPVEVHLVPVELLAPRDEAEERGMLQQLLVDVVGEAWRGLRAGSGAATEAMAWLGQAAMVTGDAVVDLADLVATIGHETLEAELAAMWTQAVILGSYVGQLPVSPLYLLHAAEQWRRAERFRASQRACTPADQPPPPPPGERRIAVLVAGFGSSSGEADVLDVDTARLGYAAADVVQFSYAGGRTAGVGALAGVEVSDYRPDDSTGDLRISGERLGQLLAAIDVAHPGVPVDVIAHSQGGVVARLALAPDPGAPVVANLVTLGSPHNGADVATANALLGTTIVGEVAQAGVAQLSGGIDGASQAAAQLAETSTLVAELSDTALPAATRTTSIAATGDLTVGALHSSLEGATNVVVPLEGMSAHADLPGSVVTRRELALALAGRGPTCRVVDGDLVRAAAISTATDAFGAGLGVAAMWADRAAPGARLPGRTPGTPTPRPTPAGAVVGPR
ncbi:MAG: peptidoglycan DD-metalloendopeptidase family protein [Actinobacteria bacterium]|nr:peptidoglycan DD-metalloendopeptidase family protein [Actinomycetota bacterium]MBW3643142.1 peptidoglycan DD-metalloendopeptidase family protein [Actinomycetota bacterium]